ncbi:hypothetical protein Pan241w_10940 [Gimesia alba]|uniref:Uncharacterized protein n=1 Tax=Gimesia alba TaxID=2527973 RepID=A0A517RAX7_9PLAN|nr:hypothetical protein [Gimesia alba]QDT41035.1 hypothetical protein Pan241w_10940 [Gimesia alba]
MSTTNSGVAEIILGQIGGARRVRMMLGVKKFYKDDNGNTLVFDFKGSEKADRVRIAYNALDLYDVQFFTTERTLTKAGEFNNVACDELVGIFEDFTEMFLTF